MKTISTGFFWELTEIMQYNMPCTLPGTHTHMKKAYKILAIIIIITVWNLYWCLNNIRTHKNCTLMSVYFWHGHFLHLFILLPNFYFITNHISPLILPISIITLSLFYMVIFLLFQQNQMLYKIYLKYIWKMFLYKPIHC